MFRWAIIKITLLYLAIIMVISLFFSINLYRISTSEIDKALNKQNDFFRGNRSINAMISPELSDYMEERLIEAKRSVFYQLLYTNIVILFLGGGVSYIFARMTLKPIEESHEAQSRFAADASHELRSPLAAMKSEIEVALRDPKLDKKEAIDIIRSNLEEVNKLQKLSEDLLELARDNGKTLKKNNCVAKEIIRESIKKASKEAKTKNIKINEDIDEKIIIFGNKESLVELFLILLDNAIKYSEEGGEINFYAHKKSGDVEIRVEDQGVGIRKEEIDHIFKRFYRAELSRSKNKVNGYGLGLSIANKIVSANNGKINVESIEGKGSTFTVTLPESSKKK